MTVGHHINVKTMTDIRLCNQCKKISKTVPFFRFYGPHNMVVNIFPLPDKGLNSFMQVVYFNSICEHSK